VTSARVGVGEALCCPLTFGSPNSEKPLKNDDPFDALWALLVSRSSGLAAAGHYLAQRALDRNGFRDVHMTDPAHRTYGSLLASKGGSKYLIEVKTRHKYKTNGMLNKRYKLADSKWGGRLYQSAGQAERRSHAKAHWIAVQVDLNRRRYSVYFGSLEQLNGRSGISMDPSDVRGYECLADKQPLPAPGNDMQPPEIQKSMKSFVQDHGDPSKTAFIMMQFGKTAAHDKIVDGIRSVLNDHGIAAVRADDKEYHSDLFWNILTYVHGCDFGVAVFERIEAETFNPNVALEVGYMMALGKPVCLLKDKTLKNLHADLMGKLYREFDPQHPKAGIARELNKWAKDKEIIP
jgi:hypothetical protein